MFRSGKDVVRVERRNKTEPKTLNNELYSCDYCSEGGWSSETEVEIHKTLYHAKERLIKLRNTKSVCSICVEDFKNKEGLLSHIKTEHLYSSADAYRVEREIFVCHYCHQIFFNKSHLTVHVTYRHVGCPTYFKVECPQCNAKLKKKQVWAHFYAHACQSISSCRQCFTKFRNRRELKQHLDRKVRYLKCDMCGFFTKKQDLFNQHIVENHKQRNCALKIKNYKKYFIPRNCLIPPKFKKASQILMMFRGVVLGNGVHICVLCREICLGQQEMKNHVTYDHFIRDSPTQNQYECICGDSFSSKVLLTHHIFKEKGDHAVKKPDDKVNKDKGNEEEGNEVDEDIDNESDEEIDNEGDEEIDNEGDKEEGNEVDEDIDNEGDEEIDNEVIEEINNS